MYSYLLLLIVPNLVTKIDLTLRIDIISPASMHIVLVVIGRIVIDDENQLFDVQAAGRNRGGDLKK